MVLESLLSPDVPPPELDDEAGAPPPLGGDPAAAPPEVDPLDVGPPLGEETEIFGPDVIATTFGIA